MNLLFGSLVLVVLPTLKAAESWEIVDEPVLPFGAALAAVVADAEADRYDEALAGAIFLAERTKLGEYERAAARFALGVLVSRNEDPAVALSAADEFESARALAGPGQLRLDATYNMGGVHLQEAERLRGTIPEIAGAQNPGAVPPGVPPGMPPMPNLPGAPGTGGGEDEEEDPLPEARKAYETAREILVERLRAEWKDANTRANLELIQRRLRELDEIERQREEQEQEQEDQQQQDQDGESDDDQEQEDQENESDEQEDGEDQESEPSQEDQESEEEADPNQDEEQEPQPPEEPGEEEQEQEEPEPGQPPEPEEGESQEMDEQEAPPPTGEPEERVLTREEVMRLLDRLAELEEEGRALEAALRRAQQKPVKRDW